MAEGSRWARLERLGLLRPPRPAAPARRADPEAVARAVGGRVEAHGDGACVVVETEEPAPGPWDLPLLARLCGRPGPIPAGGAAILDLETTGLAGASGTAVIVCGLARPEGDRLRVTQVLLPDLPDEPALLSALHRRLAGVGVLLTYNGAMFDLPVLAGRAVLARQTLALPPLHLDLLTLARRLYRAVLPRCDQRSVERHVLGREREGDLPGAEVPARYAQYLRAQEPRLLRDVLEHNRRDLAGLAALAAAWSRRLADPQGAAPEELWGLARIHLRQGEAARSLALARAALRRLPAGHPLRPRVLELAARAARRAGEPAAAAAAWAELAALPGVAGERALVELARLLERQGDAAGALACCEQALDRVRRRWRLVGLPPAPRDLRRVAELERRRARLRARLGEAAAGADRA